MKRTREANKLENRTKVKQRRKEREAEREAERSRARDERRRAVREAARGAAHVAAVEASLTAESASATAHEAQQAAREAAQTLIDLGGSLEDASFKQRSVECATTLTREQIFALEEECQSLRDEMKEIRLLQSERVSEFSLDAFRGDDKRVKFYSGLSFEALTTVFDFLAPHLRLSDRMPVTKSEFFTAVLNKLRENS